MGLLLVIGTAAIAIGSYLRDKPLRVRTQQLSSFSVAMEGEDADVIDAGYEPPTAISVRESAYGVLARGEPQGVGSDLVTASAGAVHFPETSVG